MGAEVEWPSFEERLAEFRTWLNSPPETISREEQLLRDALGLKGSHGQR